MNMMVHSILYVFRKRCVKVSFVAILCLCILMICNPNSYVMHKHPAFSELDRKEFGLKMHLTTVDAFYGNRQFWPFSILGGILFQRDDIPDPNPNENRTFVVLVWKHWNWLKRRHAFNFGKSQEDNILSDCSVKNCKFSGDDKLIDTADAVVIHLQKGDIPTVEKRNTDQRWVFLSDESPRNAFSLSKTLRDLEKMEDIFNWSMTYRSDADVPVPYGRTIGREEPIMESVNINEIASLVPYWEEKRKDVSATILMSNCGVKARNAILAELRKYIQVDIYGGCSDVPENKNRCPGHFKADCEPIASYLFYLVLENSNCFQYLTEKAFYHGYEKGAIPIIFGPAREDLETLLPPNSYLFIDKDTNIESLAKVIRMLTENLELYLSMHIWRNNFKIVNEHGYFGTKSYHFCRLCEALNFNDKSQKIYSKDDLDLILNPLFTCK